ncbi:hypothetical protein FPQ18DRAFT_267421 [Pyronema domesticum]|nr:hypothetical protein FPQ18DRAFT_267421 [Pyronema domesticum]
MAPQANEEVYVCNVCHKAFEKRTSRDRHTRRCRNKRPEDTIPRKKSCNHCATAKARCDQRRPNCTRCRTKGLGCQYAYQAPSVHSPPSEHQLHDIGGPIDLGFNDPLIMGDVDMNMGAAGDIFGGWGQNCAATSQLSLTRPQDRRDYFTAETQMQFGTPSLTLTSSSSSASTSPYPEFDLVPGSFYTNTDTSCSQAIATPESPNTSMINRAPLSVYPQVDLVSRLLSSFVPLLKKPNTAPPFIHPSRLVHRTEPLANVTALVHMTTVKSPENKSFVSSMILGEFYRLEKSLSNLDPDGECTWEALEQFQAMVVLALVRMFDGEMEPRELHTFENCSTRIGLAGLFTTGKPSNEETWEKWLIAESKRRTFATVFLLDRLFHYRQNLAPFSCDGMSAVQLPAARSVWEAESEKEWRKQNEAVRTFPGWSGELDEWVTLKELWEGSPRMGVWYAGIDALGTAMMADSVVHVSGAMKQARERCMMG